MPHLLRAAALSAFVVLVSSPVARAHEADSPDVKDHPTIPRFPGTVIASGSSHDFGAYEFTLADGATKRVEGHDWDITYSIAEGAKTPSPLEVSRNYGNQFKKKGGSVLFEQINAGGGVVTMKMPSGTGETWLEIDVNNSGEQLMFHIVTSAPMEQKVELTADELGEALKTSGHIALYGILFDNGKDTVKPASEPVLAEIAKLLQQDAALKLGIEGHTDNVGKKKENQTLSKKRAESVKAWLVARKISAARLDTSGLGDTKPVGPNDSDEGRAKNRRVELVRR